MLPGDPRLRPALERAIPADTVPDDTFRLEGIPCDVLFGDGRWHPARLVARWRDRNGREVVQIEWFAELSTWTEEYLADPEKIRED